MDDSLIGANRTLLEQGIELLTGVDDRLYSEPGRRGASVGDHVRHIVEHYTCLLAGLGPGTIDYDARRRDPEIARHRHAALRGLTEVGRNLAGLDRSRLSGLIRVAIGEGKGTGPGDWAASTVKRELLFLFSHTIHHYALIAQRLAEASVEVEEEFGVAPSTLRHRARSAETASVGAAKTDAA